MTCLVSFMLCVGALAVQCYRLQRALEKAQRDYQEADRLFRVTFTEMVNSNKKAIKMRMNRDVWLERWKEGAFEMDVATMASLAEQEGEALEE